MNAILVLSLSGRWVGVMTAGIAAINDRCNTVPEFPIHECPQRKGKILAAGPI